MDEIALLRALAPEDESPDAARAAALQKLEARLGPAPAAPAAPAHPTRRRRLLTRRRLLRRRRQLALAGAGAALAVAVGLLVGSSGSNPETAAAAVLRQTGAVAAAGPESTPGPGQFLYTKTKRFELQSWLPGKLTVGGGLLSQKGAFDALDTWQEEEWRSPDGQTRSRWVMGTPQFLSGAEQARWEAAGSPLPGSFECDRRCFPDARIIDLRPGVTDVETEGSGLPDLSSLPTEAKALRLAIEDHRVSLPWTQEEPAGSPSTPGQVIGELWDILDKPNTTPELRAAVFGALAEEPGIELNRNATDLVGRSGYALSYESTGADGYGEEQPGIRVEYIFDPETSAVLGRRDVIADPAKLGWAKGIPAGTVRREVAYLGSGIVDSSAERPGESGERGAAGVPST